MTFFISSFEIRRSIRTATAGLLFVAGGLICLHLSSQLSLYVFPMKSVQRLKQHLESSRYGLAESYIVTLGNSHNVAAIAPHTFQDPLIHLSTPLQSLSGSLFYLRYFQQRIGKAKVVLLPVSVGILEQDTQLRPITVRNLVTVDGWQWEYLRLSHDLDILIRSWALPLARMDAWRGPFESMFRDGESAQGQQIDPFQNDRVARHLAFLQGGDAEQTRARNLESLTRIAEICDELDACLVLYESPVSRNYRESFARQRPDYGYWKDTLRRFVANAQSELPVFFVEDLWSPEESGNPEYYKDQEHLSRAGRLRFSQRIQQCLAATLNGTPFGDLQLCKTHRRQRWDTTVGREASAAVPPTGTTTQRVDELWRR